MTLCVLIAGGGIGGLTLAHGLRAAGLDTHIFERGPAQHDLSTSYRIHIDANGSQALHACLPPERWAEFQRRAAVAPRGLAFTNERLQHLDFVADVDPARDPIAHSHPISRAGLRQLLLGGLDDVVTFNTRVAGYEQLPDGRVVVQCTDGSTASGDVLVGADGSASAVRKQRLPDAHVVDTGVGGIAGKVYLNERVRERAGARLLSQMTMVLPMRGGAMFIAPFQRRPERVEPDDALDLPPHLFWTVIGRAHTLGVPHAAGVDGAQLQQIALRRVARWHPDLRWLVEQTDLASLLAIPLHSAPPVPAWEPSNVTLLGDAIHTMTPLQGLGGNTALRDAATLCQQLVQVDRGSATLGAAIGAYEADMRAYGFDAVQRSLQISTALASTSILQRAAFRSVLQVAHRLPWLHDRLFERPTLTPERFVSPGRVQLVGR